MKNQLSSLDILILIKELKRSLFSAKIQKIYSIGERGLNLTFYSKNIPFQHSANLVIMPNYFCISKYKRKAPKQPTSFIMQLRKYMKNSIIKEINQHNLDRIIEFSLEGKLGNFLFIAEIFSKGNFILCKVEKEKKEIIGLLEKQKWKHRILKVGNTYEYPPAIVNPFNLTLKKFKQILLNLENKSLVAALANNLNLGGNFSEEVCLLSNINKKIEIRDLSENDVKILFNSMNEILSKIDEFGNKENTKPAIVFDDNGKEIDVIPFDMKIYHNFRKKYFKSFNDAIDEYFSKIDSIKIKLKLKDLFNQKAKKLEVMKKKQEIALNELKIKEKENREIGNAIYQNLSSIEKILRLVKKTKNRKELIDKVIDGIKIKNIDGNLLVIELKKFS
ncbi:hypothetical protein DRN73_10315 [Candidatus Pacearchaeota archaeon]|nr:MAG: hypothetical protein DRN73_10315 [Candidatus Pacearchaeota archaeon]